MEIKIEKDSLLEVLTLLIDKTEIEHITIKLKPSKEPKPNGDK
jgi:hypothetical protein